MAAIKYTTDQRRLGRTRRFMYWSGSKEEEFMSSRVIRLEDEDVISGEDIEGSGE